MKQTTLDGRERNVEYKTYRARKILNVYNHVDYWFWNRYSAHPYVGCEHACEYCYARADKYLHTDTPEDFSRIIKVKRNAVELLRKELKKVRKDVLVTGDYQPAEQRFGLSRKMLEVVQDLEFPVHVVEKSDLVLKDLDVLKAIDENSWACVSFSFSTVDGEISTIFEPIAPSPERRLAAMREVATAGILTGANLMPVLPFITDSEELMGNVIEEVKNHGGKFVLIGGLTLDDNVRTRYFRLLKNRFPDLYSKYENLYGSEIHEYFREISKKGMKICEKYGLRDRIPRYCLNFNQEVAEKLFEKVYRLELENPKKAWPYRKTAWMVDEMDTDIRDIEDLKMLQGVGEKIAVVVEKIIGDCHH
jgi:DNA repair photolyase